jgi:hypothetical protein
LCCDDPNCWAKNLIYGDNDGVSVTIVSLAFTYNNRQSD